MVLLQRSASGVGAGAYRRPTSGESTPNICEKCFPSSTDYGEAMVSESVSTFTFSPGPLVGGFILIDPDLIP